LTSPSNGIVARHLKTLHSICSAFSSGTFVEFRNGMINVSPIGR
jgi:hypothetical protein